VDIKYSGDSAVVGIDTRVYPLEAATKAAYMFLDRSYMFLFHDDEGTLRVRLKPKPDHAGQAADLADEFLNELLNQSVRHQIVTKTRNLRELIMGRALYSQCLEIGTAAEESGGEGQPITADPLGIGRDWFEKNESGGTQE
jgi:His-Xaa-Ser system protein HxsD